VSKVEPSRPTLAPGATHAKKGSPVWTVVRLTMAVLLLWYLVTSGGLEWRALGAMFTRWELSLMALTLLAASAVATSWRFQILLRASGMEITLPSSVRLTLIGMFFNTVLPGGGGGDLVRFYYGARGHEGHRTRIVTVMLFDRICGIASMILWPLLAAPVFASMWLGNDILTALLGAGLAFGLALTGGFAVSWTPLAASGGWIERTLARLPLGALAWRGVETIASYRHHRSAVAAGLGVSLGVHACQIGAALIVAYMVNPTGFSWAMSGLIPMGFMANAVPLTPGGLGVGEAAFDALFALADLDGGAEVLLGWRLLVVVIGLSGLVAYLHGRRDFIRADAGAPAG
jgi:hypothetical protein